MVPVLSLDMGMTFGFEHEWETFGKKHPNYEKAYNSLIALVEHAIPWVPGRGAAQNIAHQLRLECVENYMKILILGGKAYGHAAWRELRSLYEKAVTANHLLQHPDDVDRFIQWTTVSKHKMLVAMKQSGWPVEPSLSKEAAAKIEADYQAIKPLFESTQCKVCGRTGVGPSWHAGGFVQMALKAGSLSIYLVPAYYEGLLYSHPSYFAVLQKTDKEAGHLTPLLEVQPNEAYRALKFAHGIMLESCAQHMKSMGLSPAPELVSKAVDDFNLAWNEKTAFESM